MRNEYVLEQYRTFNFMFSGLFPQDFSILVTLRPEQSSTSILFGIYTSNGDDQLLVEIGDRIRLFYQDQDTSIEDGTTLEFKTSINDGKYVHG